jgi:hypothetical protein
MYYTLTDCEILTFFLGKYDLVYDTFSQEYTLKQNGDAVTDHWTKVSDGVIIGEIIAGVIAGCITVGIGKMTGSIVKAIIAGIILGIIDAIPQFIEIDGIAGAKAAELKFNIFSDGVYKTTWSGVNAFHFSKASLVKGFLLGGSVDFEK